MRTILIALLALGAAAPAVAQIFPTPGLTTSPQSLILENQLQAEQQMARQRSIAQDNQMMALEAQIQTNQAVAGAQALTRRPTLTLPSDPNAPIPQIDASKLASIPDSVLAASNQRVRQLSGVSPR